MEMLAGPGTRRIDLRGRLAIPAFHDAHMHLMALGRQAKSLDISPGAVSSVADFDKAMRSVSNGATLLLVKRGDNTFYIAVQK